MRKKYLETSTEKSFSNILDKSKKKTLTFKELTEELLGKTRPILILFLSLPFCIPLPFPGLSTPFGLAIMFFAPRIIFGGKAYLPKKLLRKKISPKLLKKIIEKGLWLLQKIKPFIHPRFSWVFKIPIHILSGLIIFIMGFFLALPLPVPFTNLIPAWSIFLTSLGMIEEDGLCIILGLGLGLFLLLLSLFLFL